MNWSRLGTAAVLALVISFVLGAVLSPPDPFTQLLYAGLLFLVTLPLVYWFEPWAWT